MITTISLVNICPHTYLEIFLLVMSTFKICSFSNFQICKTVLLTTVTMLYFTSLWLTYFITGSLCLWTPFAHFLQPYAPTYGNDQSVLCTTLVVFVFFLDSTYKRDHTIFIFLWLISLSIMPSRSIHVVTNGKISFLFMAE